MKKVIVLLLCLLVMPSLAFAKAARITAYGLIGGAAGDLDAVECEDIKGDNTDRAIATGDMAEVIVSGVGTYWYIYDAAASDAESSPTIIVPDDRVADCAGNGQWDIVSFIATLPADATKVFDGTGTWVDIEDLADEIAAGIAEGELANSVVVAADIKDGEVGYADMDGTYKAQLVEVSDPDTWTMSGDGMYGGSWIATAAGSADLPEATVNMNFCVKVEATAAVTLTSLTGGTADTIYLDGVAETQDEDIVSSGTAGDMVCCEYRAANTWSCMSYGWDGATD